MPAASLPLATLRLFVTLTLLACPSRLAAGQTIYRIMPVGDSITEGGASFSNWRYPLWEKLFTAGYLVEYVGSRKSPSRIGDLAHEGYGGKDSGFLAATVPANFRKHPADIVLLHAGHNHFADQMPVPRIVADTTSMIESFREANPAVTILLARPIPSGKLPKYSYIPDLHLALAALAKRLDRPGSRVVIVPQGRGFDPAADTVADMVHPNASGAAKMADRWFEALVTVMEKPERSYQPEVLSLSPVIDNGPDGYGPDPVKARHQEFSPLHNLRPGTPPTLIFLGTRDKLIPVATGRNFQSRIQASGGRCDLSLFPDAGHPIYAYRAGPSPLRDQILDQADAFLASLGLLPPG